MQAIEFTTTLHNGTLTIPSQYLSEWEGKEIRVIVLEDIKSHPKPVENRKNKKFDAISLNTKEFQFNRQEANE